MQLSGVVVRVVGEWAEIRVAELAGCKSCGRCSLGTTSNLSEVRAYNLIGAGPGDEVIIEVDSQGVIKASAWLYLLPVLFLLAGLVLGDRWLGDSGALLLGVIALLAALYLLRAGDSWWSSQRYQSRVIKKCQHEDIC